MIEIKFEKYEGKGRAEWHVLGTLKAIAGKGGTIGFMKRNFNNPAVNVAVLVTRADGTSKPIPCKAEVSKMLRAGKLTLPQLASLPVIGAEVTNEETGKLEQIFLVVLPEKTAGVQSFNVDEIEEVKVANVEAEAAFLPEELVAF